MWPTLTGVDAQGSARAKPKRPPQNAPLGEGEPRLRPGAGTSTKCGASSGPSGEVARECSAEIVCGTWESQRSRDLAPARRAGRTGRTGVPSAPERWAPRRAAPRTGGAPRWGRQARARACAPPPGLSFRGDAASCAAPLLSALLGGEGDSAPDLSRGSGPPCDLASH